MKIHIHKCGESVGAEFAGDFERRVRFAMGKFGPRIARLELFLSDENDPRGGIDKSCRLVARLDRDGELTVRDADTDWSALAARVVDRMARLVRRTLERRRARRFSTASEGNQRSAT